MHSEEAPAEVRRQAFALLKARYDADDRGADVVRSLETALGFAGREEAIALHREAGERLAVLGRHAEATEHWATLLALAPDAVDARDRLRSLAEHTGDHARLAQALIDAVEACGDASLRVDLYTEAAEVRRAALGDAEGAIALLSTALPDTEGQPAAARSVSRRLADLYEAAGRDAERLDMLERLARLEPEPAERRAVLGRAARLAERLGDADRAFGAWQARLETDPGDSEALDAAIDLLEREERWAPLVDALRRRVRSEVPAFQRRADLERIARTQGQKLEAPEEAIETWAEIASQSGEDATVVDALSVLYEATGRSADLASLLERATSRESAHVADVLARLGDVCRTILDEPARGAQAYRRALVAAPDHEASRAGLTALLDIEEARADAVEALAAAYEETDDWQPALGLLEHRLAAARGPRAQVRLLREAAGVQETRGETPEQALASIRRAFALDPEDGRLEAEVGRLAEVTRRFDMAAEAMHEAAEAAVAIEPRRAAELFVAEATLREQRLEDAAGALAAWSAALAQQPARVDAANGVVRTAEKAEWWEAAEAALGEAVGAGAGAEARAHLVAIRRRAPGRPLFDALLGLAEARPDDLDPIHEAAVLALDTLEDGSLAGQVLTRLYDESARRVRRGAGASGERTPAECATWAGDQLVRMAEEAGDHAGALALLVDLASLPGDPAASLARRRRAAAIAVEELGDRARGMRLYRAILEDAPDDARSFDALAALYAEERRLPELLSLRQRELAETSDPDRRLVLRLAVAELVDAIDREGGRVESLRANLAERPGHAPSVDAITKVLSEQGRVAELVELLSDQADRLEQAEEREEAARLWAEVASLCETRIADDERALKAHRKVVELSPRPESLEALARIHTSRGEHAAAAQWLERRLSGLEPGTRTDVALRLARALLAADKKERAIQVLETARSEEAANAEVREMLAASYRAQQSWEPLARLLSDATEHVPEGEGLLDLVREAADLYHHRLGTPELAIGVLEKGAALAPKDRGIRTMLAESLRAAGRHDEAREILEDIVASFGRRRNADRAAIHHQLARVARAQGDLETALEQLELASKMDMSNASILRTLGDLSRERNEPDWAERAYRTLLLVVRRRSDDAPTDVGVAEVLYELHRIAEDRGDASQANELLESALETAAQSAAESRRLKEALLEQRQPQLLMQALERRLALTEAGSERADVLADLADVLDRALGAPDKALERRLEALREAPTDAALHDAALDIARRAGKVPAYVKAVESALDNFRRPTDALVTADMLLRLAAVHETDLDDLEAAGTLYTRAEETGARSVDAWLGLARVAGRRGQADEQLRVLSKLVDATDVPADARTEACYQLAQVQLASEAHREEGVANLRVALDRDPMPARAGAMLRGAAEADPSDDAVLGLYEEVARASGDDALMLDYIERRAARPDVTLREIREGVERATSLEETGRADALLERAVDLARAQEGAGGQARWALLALSERREAAGEMAEAIGFLRDAVALSEGDEAFELSLRLAALASGEGGDLGTAAEVYERLLEPDPTNRQVFEPLLAVYHRLGDEDRMANMVRNLLDALLDPEPRNAVRMKWAEHLLASPERQFDAVDVLKDVLLDAPDHAEAAARLADLYEKSGYDEDLVELLQRQLDVARDNQDLEQIAELTLRLGALLEKVRREDAVDVYRRAFDWVPTERRVIEAMLALLGPDDDARERTEVRERLLATEEGERAGALARELFDAWQGYEDEAGMQRALELGYRGHPDDAELRERLEAWYRQREDWANLATFLEAEAQRVEDPSNKVAHMRAAAALLRDDLGDPARAVEALRSAREMVPTDTDLLEELATTLAAAGRHGDAIEEVTASLEANAGGSMRVQLLRLRARFRLEAGDDAAAVADLEEAYLLDPPEVAPELIAALDRLRGHAIGGGDAETERAASLRLVDVLGDAGDGERARDVMAAWVERSPEDREALVRLRGMDEAAQRWDAVAVTCARLVGLEEGGAQIEAALGLADACERAGRAEDARPGLEQAYLAHTEDPRLGTRLRALYEQIGAHRELAAILLQDAQSEEDPATRFELLKHAGRLLAGPDGDPEAALAPLAEAAQLNPEDHEVTVYLADGYMGAGHWEEAGQLLEQAIASHTRRRSPELSMLQHRMARLAAAAGDPSLQMQWLGAALDSDKNNGEVASELAHLAMELGEHDVALNALRAVTLMKSDGPMSRAMAFLLQAKIAHHRGEARRALLWARKAKSEDPELEEASAFLQELGE